jgi:hypothetical protein
MPNAYARLRAPMEIRNTENMIQVVVRSVKVITIFAAVAAAGGYAYLVAFSAFLPYDDEGYILVLSKKFCSGEALYDKVFSQYGPFFSMYFWAAWKAGLYEFTHDSGRLWTIFHWMLTAIITGGVAYRLTRSYLVFVFVFFATAYHLTSLVFEPGHPQGIIIVGSAILALLMTSVRSTSATRALAAGAVVGALAMTKINVGAFAYAGCAFGASLAAAQLGRVNLSLWQRAIIVLVFALSISFPWIVMRQHAFNETWAFRYAVIVSTALFGLSMTARMVSGDPSNPITPRPIVLFHTGLFVAVFASAVFVVLRGTTFASLIDGILMRPLRFPTQFNVLPEFPAASMGTCALSAFAAAYTAVRQSGKYWLILLRIVRILIPMGFFMGLSTFRTPGQEFVERAELLAYFAPFVWLYAVQARAETSRRPDHALAAIAPLAVLLSLQAYPVFGTQSCWATLLLIPVFAIILHDEWMAVRIPKLSNLLSTSRRTREWCSAATGILIVAGFYFFARVPEMYGMYTGSPSLELPGSARLRLESAMSAEIHSVTNNVRAHADSLVGSPGLNSFYIWTQIDPLTGFNASSWIYLLEDQEEQAVVTRLEANKRPCAVLSPRLTAFWKKDREFYRGPLVRYLEDQFVPFVKTPTYEVAVRRDRVRHELYNALLFGERDIAARGGYALAQGAFDISPPFTLSFWFQCTGQGVLLSFQDRPYPEHPTTFSQLIMYVANGKLGFLPWTVQTSAFEINDKVIDGKMRHVAVVFSEADQIVYLDGQEKMNKAVEFQPMGTALYPVLGDGIVNRSATEAGWLPLPGKIADARLYSRPLSHLEVNELYGKGF